MTQCTGTPDWRGGLRTLARPRATLRSHALVHGSRVDPAPREPNPRTAGDDGPGA
ncbi:hypothetical protein GCM10023094_05760 [Rhodococcus olei]|uniref:Uncharacterized protein n=1 Tax=Rhodococcus olei TaxID=2161675 RepID=A0ABP8NXB5_9NOCA